MKGHRPTELTTAKLRRALAYQQRGALAQAELLCREVLATASQDPGALHLLGLIRAQRGDAAEAATLIERALRIKPDDAGAHLNLGNALHAQRRYDDALASYERAHALKPDYAEALNNQGVALRELQRHEDALASYDRALALEPRYAEALNNRGVTLHALRRYEEALASYDQALILKPSYAEALTNRGAALHELRKYGEALESYDRGLALQPGPPDAVCNRGATLQKLKRYEDTARSYENLLRVAPDYPFAKGRLLHAKLFCCEWQGLRQLIQSIDHDIRNGKAAAEPFVYQAVSDSPQMLRLCAETYASQNFPLAKKPLWAGERYEHRRIRLGYVSGEWGQHATSRLMVELFERHDKKRFELFAFDNGSDDGSEIRARINTAFDAIVDISRLADFEAAVVIKRNEIDILVDLNGYFGRARPGIFGCRPCPVQIGYLGFPGTLGTDYLDYIIADERVIPPDHQAFYTEKVIYLPDSYQANDAHRSAAPDMPSRGDVLLPPTAFVFCCFNNNYKITPEVFDVWMRLLKKVDGSVLWLLEDNPPASRNLRREAETRGVVPERLVFAPRINLEQHLSRLKLADLFLDTLPCNAHATASDALWAGLPLLTCTSGAFAGRVGGSLLRALGLPELITGSLEEYEALALELAAKSAMLSEIRAKLMRNRSTHPLFDTNRLRGHVESAYVTVWERYSRGEPPTGFTVNTIAR